MPSETGHWRRVNCKLSNEACFPSMRLFVQAKYTRMNKHGVLTSLFAFACDTLITITITTRLLAAFWKSRNTDNVKVSKEKILDGRTAAKGSFGFTRLSARVQGQPCLQTGRIHLISKLKRNSQQVKEKQDETESKTICFNEQQQQLNATGKVNRSYF